MPDIRRAANTNRKTTSMVSLAYQFIFERDANIWNNVHEFEEDLADFFNANGIEADVVNTIDGSNGLRVIIIRKGVVEPETLKNPKGVQLSSNPSGGKSQGSKQIVRTLTKQIKGGIK